MREILFRGKCNGEWVYGYYYSKRGKDIHNNEGVFHFIKNEELNHPIKPESLGQYAELDDANGKKIFEGDIIKMTARPNMSNNQFYAKKIHHETVGVVLTEKGRLVVRRTITGGSYYLIWLYEDDYNFEIIGNIHDNPELLKQE